MKRRAVETPTEAPIDLDLCHKIARVILVLCEDCQLRGICSVYEGAEEAEK